MPSTVIKHNSLTPINPGIVELCLSDDHNGVPGTKSNFENNVPPELLIKYMPNLEKLAAIGAATTIDHSIIKEAAVEFSAPTASLTGITHTSSTTAAPTSSTVTFSSAKAAQNTEAGNGIA